MAWTITNWANADWSAAATLNEFVGAVNERKLAVGQAEPFATVIAGDDVQAASFFAGIPGYINFGYQLWIESRYGDFVVSHDAGTPRTGETFDDSVYGSLAEVFSAAGLAHSNWRRYTTHPDDGGDVAYGKMQAGDIIGPWIFEDIQKCLNVLVWMIEISIGWQDVVKYSGWGESRGSGATWAAAKAAAEADYASGAFGPRYPAAATEGFWQTWTPGERFIAQLWRSEAKAYAYIPWFGKARYADWWVRASKLYSDPAESIFDAYGDGVIEDTWHRWSEDTPATADGTIVSGSKLGVAATMPNNPWCNEPGSGKITTGRGWNRNEVDSEYNVRLIVRWNVTGGFTYV